MNIETKYNVNDIVWVINGSELIEVNIKRIEIEILGYRYNPNLDGKIRIYYQVVSEDSFSNFKSSRKANELYETKQEAGEAWMDSQGLKCGIKGD